jgi:hypothetical protein
MRQDIRLIVSLCIALLAASLGCSGGNVLTDGHQGWGKANCESCHSLPVKDHTADRSPQCAQCHGANGACDPVASNRAHTTSEDCVSCHQQQHGFSSQQDCVSCHFETEGLRACP